jgi:hypothetical protein
VEFEVGFFPLRNRPDVDPYVTLIPAAARTTPVWEPIQGIPPSIDLAAYESATGHPIDYVFVFGRTIAASETVGDPRAAALDAQLGRLYARVATSPNGLLEVYERQDSPAAIRGTQRRAAAPERCPGA